MTFSAYSPSVTATPMPQPQPPTQPQKKRKPSVYLRRNPVLDEDKKQT